MGSRPGLWEINQPDRNAVFVANLGANSAAVALGVVDRDHGTFLFARVSFGPNSAED
jgi:hypothetical protein